MKDNARIFLTDYASYNEGTQFEFGHWVELDQFDDAEELNEYIGKHFEECDRKRPLLCGSPREEIMITDFEGYPRDLYSESPDFEQLFNFFDAVEDIDFDCEHDMIELHNNFCAENNQKEGEILDFSDPAEFFNLYFLNDPYGAAMAVQFGDVNWSDNYIVFENGDLKTLHNPTDQIDETALIDWIIEINC